MGTKTRLRNEDILVYGGRNKCSTIDLIYVGDIAKILIQSLYKAMAGDIGNVFEAGSGIPMRVWDIANIVVNACNSQSKIIEVPMRPGESEGAYVVASNPYPLDSYRKLEDFLPETIEFYRNQI